VVAWGRKAGDDRRGSRTVEVGQPRGAGGGGVLPNDQSGTPDDGVEPVANGRPAGKQAEVIWGTTARSPVGQRPRGSRGAVRYWEEDGGSAAIHRDNGDTIKKPLVKNAPRWRELWKWQGGDGPYRRRSLATSAGKYQKKWDEAWNCAKKGINRKKYRMPKTQRPSGGVARESKRLAERFHQLRMGHCRTGQHLTWTKNADTTSCGYKTQTREHQEPQTTEGAAENSVGRCGGSREEEEPFQNPRPASGRTVHPIEAGRLRTTEVGAEWNRKERQRGRRRAVGERLRN